MLLRISKILSRISSNRKFRRLEDHWSVRWKVFINHISEIVELHRSSQPRSIARNQRWCNVCWRCICVEAWKAEQIYLSGALQVKLKIEQQTHRLCLSSALGGQVMVMLIVNSISVCDVSVVKRRTRFVRVWMSNHVQSWMWGILNLTCVHCCFYLVLMSFSKSVDWNRLQWTAKLFYRDSTRKFGVQKEFGGDTSS